MPGAAFDATTLFEMTAVRQREVGRAFSSDTTHRELHLSVGARPRTVLRAGCTVPGPPSAERRGTERPEGWC